MYEFTFLPVDGRIPVLKYGITDVFKGGYDRPESQKAMLMAMYGPSVNWKPVMMTPNRELALAAEEAAVTKHVAMYHEMPRAQTLPKPK